MRSTWAAWGVMLGALIACGGKFGGDRFGSGDAPGNADETGSSGDSAPAPSGSGDGGSDGSDASTGGPAGSGPKLDVLGSGDPPGGPGCDKVDFLFVVDNSGSMDDEQANLVTSFPGFISTIRDTLNATDYQIMVVDSDQLEGSGTVGGTMCGPDPNCCDEYCAAEPNAPCNGEICPNADCAAILGAGKVAGSAGQDCGVAGDSRFLVDGQPDLDATFSCLARVGTDGNGNEQMMAALGNATGILNESDGCNEGFLRDDAILVVTIISDEDDGAGLIFGSPGDPASWKQALVQAKNGNEEAIVVLGLVGDSDLPDGLCPPYDEDGNGAEPAPNLREFVGLFGDRGLWASVCEPDYAPFFVTATSTIDTTCDEFEPEG